MYATYFLQLPKLENIEVVFDEISVIKLHYYLIYGNCTFHRRRVFIEIRTNKENKNIRGNAVFKIKQRNMLYVLNTLFQQKGEKKLNVLDYLINAPTVQPRKKAKT